MKKFIPIIFLILLSTLVTAITCDDIKSFCISNNTANIELTNNGENLEINVMYEQKNLPFFKSKESYTINAFEGTNQITLEAFPTNVKSVSINGCKNVSNIIYCDTGKNYLKPPLISEKVSKALIKFIFILVFVFLFKILTGIFKKFGRMVHYTASLIVLTALLMMLIYIFRHF